jgi:hypothetical protein
MTRARLVISPTMLRLARPAIVAWICRMLRSVDRGERHDLADDMLWGRWSSEVFATRFRGPHSGGDTLADQRSVLHLRIGKASSNECLL